MTDQTSAQISGNAELIRDVVRFCKTHCEKFSVTETEGSVKVDPGHGFFLSISPTNPDGLLNRSHEYREKMIAIWTAEAIKRFGGA